MLFFNESEIVYGVGTTVFSNTHGVVLPSVRVQKITIAWNTFVDSERYWTATTGYAGGRLLALLGQWIR